MVRWKYAAIAILLLLLLIGLFNLFSPPGQKVLQNEISYSQFLTELKQDNIGPLILSGDQVSGTFKDGRAFVANIARTDKTVDMIVEKNVPLSVGEDLPTVLGVFVAWWPSIAYLIFLWFFVGRFLGRIERRIESLEKTLASLQPSQSGDRQS